MSPISETQKSKPKPAVPLTFGKPEKRSLGVTIALWSFIIVMGAAILWMIINGPRDKELVCRHTGQPSLIGFGTCTDE